MICIQFSDLFFLRQVTLFWVLSVLLTPSKKDRERAVYGLKEKNLAKIYIKLIPLQPKDPDAIRMLNWKRP